MEHDGTELPRSSTLTHRAILAKCSHGLEYLCPLRLDDHGSFSSDSRVRYLLLRSWGSDAILFNMADGEGRIILSGYSVGYNVEQREASDAEFEAAVQPESTNEYIRQVLFGFLKVISNSKSLMSFKSFRMMARNIHIIYKNAYI